MGNAAGIALDAAISSSLILKVPATKHSAFALYLQSMFATAGPCGRARIRARSSDDLHIR